MMPIVNRGLSADATTALSGYQAEINALPTYPERVTTAKAIFPTRNRETNPTFREVRKVLALMCSGARRCAYCEDSMADEVEHIRPKDLYPEDTFVWMNYLYACGPCNGPKNSQFALVDALGNLVDVSRPHGAPITPPPAGLHALIDPRTEDPTSFIRLDIVDTFWYVPIDPKGTVRHARADFTIRVLRLNLRDVLPIARRSAFVDFQAHLVAYAAERDKGAPQERLNLFKEEIRRRQHPSVWFEMKRQRQLPALVPLFERVPEAANW